jgi:translation initiation factor eIF-2B subunit delta
VAPAEELLSEPEREDLALLKPHLPQSLLKKLGEDSEESDKKAQPGDVLKWIEGSDNLQMLQILYDVTPAEYIHIVITEYGSLPPSSVPVVHRQSTDQQNQKR